MTYRKLAKNLRITSGAGGQLTEFRLDPIGGGHIMKQVNFMLDIRQKSSTSARAICAQRDLGVVRGDSMAILDLIGKAMMDPGVTYAAARKKRKNKGSTPSPDVRCMQSCIAQCGNISNCRDLGVSNGMCHYTCVDGTGPGTSGPSDMSTTEMM